MSGIYQLTVGVLFVLSVALGQRSGDVYILFTDSYAKQIWKLDFNNSNYSNIVIENHENPIAIDYDPVMNKIYWTDVGRPDIRTCGFNGENLSLVRKLKPGSVPDGLTLDPVSRLIFYTDTGNDVIALIDMADFYHKTIINTNLDEPRGIALDRTQRMMYWTDWGAEAKIERATYLGESRTTLVSTGLIWPNGITLDTEGQKIYWCDAKTNVIEVLDFDGNNRRQIAHRDSFHPFDIFLFEQVLYTTDWTSKRIYQVYLDERNMTSLNGSHFKRLNGIHVFRAGAFQNDTNTCTTNKGGCEQICIPTSGGRQCACRDGYTLITNGLNCTGQADVFALFTDSLAKQIWKLDVINSIYSNIVIENHENPIAIDYDPVMNKIYWTDVGRPDIRKCGFNGEDLSLVRKLKPGSVPDGLTLDPVSRLIFYTDMGNDVIALMDMDDYYHKTIINTNLDQPRGIALDRTQRMMYWTDWGEKPKIETATYLGESRTTLVSTGLIWPNGITLDTQGKKIYWCDAKIHKIEAMDYDGRNRRQIAHGSSFHPFDIFLFEQVLYTTDWGSRRIFRVYLDGRNETSWGGRHFKRLNGIHVFRAGAFQNDTNACTTNKGDCEQICIPTSGGRQCTCRDGYTLTTNELNCTVHNACSWCYPGQCGGELLSADCVCHPGFTGHHCQTITTKPAMHVLVQMTNSDEQRFEIDSTDNQASFWTNVNNPTSVHYNLSAQYTAQSSGTLPDKPAYIEDFHVIELSRFIY
ncbi:low-density lipoprotein receptor-related protein 6-like [Gigantopelta aegis]|uniref:low-density lipoprotein receptor-related protein 6-like n=1 Tax=Gigantopelta aegis TaxID=1735272 RepID=UPI001B8880C4|nr:low-density lipoprotein receptor-related protein 6-like [Gigantopelta aegis]